MHSGVSRWRLGPRASLALMHDTLAAAATWWLAFWLRLNLDIPPPFGTIALKSMAVAVPLQCALFLYFGLYRGLWRYASLHDLRLILTTVAASAVATPAALVLLRMVDPVPRSVFILQPLLLLLMMGGSRLAYRSWKERRLARHGDSHTDAERVLIVGSGEAANSLIRELGVHAKWRVVGLLDDDSRKRGLRMHGVSVLGRIEEVADWAERARATQAIIAMPSASHEDRRRAVHLCGEAGLKVLTVPSYADLLSGRVRVSQLREVELEDLLGRDPVVLDAAGLADLITGRSVMVSGAGGSIGSELCRQIAVFKPASLICFDLSEFALYQLEQEFLQNAAPFPIVCAVGDAKDRGRVGALIDAHRPSVIFHAAAYKHVPLMEQVNAWEATRNNVLGTFVLADCARELGVSKFVLISTDKAVNPTNVMGASKRLAEMVCQAIQIDSKMSLIMVRFGNVLGSTGSVVPKFKQQIESGGPITVTHPDVTRYFMSIPEAAQLVLQAGLMGEGGEIFVLDMGEPVKIVDLARDMIRLSGMQENEIPIVFTGLRPGEKLFEELLADDESTLPTPHSKLRIARARAVTRNIFDDLMEWISSERPLSDDEVREGLQRFVPEYTSGAGTTRPASDSAPSKIEVLHAAADR